MNAASSFTVLPEYADDPDEPLKVIDYTTIYDILKRNPKDRPAEDLWYLMHLPVELLREKFNTHAQLYARHFCFAECKADTQIFASKSKKNEVFLIIEGSFIVTNRKNEVLRAYKNLEYFVQADVMKEFADFQEVRAEEFTQYAVISDRMHMEVITVLKNNSSNNNNSNNWILFDFLWCQALFKSWSFSQLCAILPSFSIQTFGKNTYVFTENQDSNFVYFIYAGVFEIRQNFSSNTPTTKTLKGADEALHLKAKTAAKKSEKTISKEFKVRNAWVGECVGEDDVIAGTKRTFSLMCQSLAGSVACISAETFMNSVYTVDQAAIDAENTKKQVIFERNKDNIRDQLNSFGKFLVHDQFVSSSNKSNHVRSTSNQVKTPTSDERIPSPPTLPTVHEPVPSSSSQDRITFQRKQRKNMTTANTYSTKTFAQEDSEESELWKRRFGNNKLFSSIEELSDQAIAALISNNLQESYSTKHSSNRRETIQTKMQQIQPSTSLPPSIQQQNTLSPDSISANKFNFNLNHRGEHILQDQSSIVISPTELTTTTTTNSTQKRIKLQYPYRASKSQVEIEISQLQQQEEEESNESRLSPRPQEHQPIVQNQENNNKIKLSLSPRNSKHFHRTSWMAFPPSMTSIKEREQPSMISESESNRSFENKQQSKQQQQQQMHQSSPQNISLQMNHPNLNHLNFDDSLKHLDTCQSSPRVQHQQQQQHQQVEHHIQFGEPLSSFSSDRFLLNSQPVQECIIEQFVEQTNNNNNNNNNNTQINKSPKQQSQYRHPNRGVKFQSMNNISLTRSAMFTSTPISAKTAQKRENQKMITPIQKSAQITSSNSSQTTPQIHSHDDDSSTKKVNQFFSSAGHHKSATLTATRPILKTHQNLNNHESTSHFETPPQVVTQEYYQIPQSFEQQQHSTKSPISQHGKHASARPMTAVPLGSAFATTTTTTTAGSASLSTNRSVQFELSSTLSSHQHIHSTRPLTSSSTNQPFLSNEIILQNSIISQSIMKASQEQLLRSPPTKSLIGSNSFRQPSKEKPKKFQLRITTYLTNASVPVSILPSQQIALKTRQVSTTEPSPTRSPKITRDTLEDLRSSSPANRNTMSSSSNSHKNNSTNNLLNSYNSNQFQTFRAPLSKFTAEQNSPLKKSSQTQIISTPQDTYFPGQPSNLQNVKQVITPHHPSNRSNSETKVTLISPKSEKNSNPSNDHRTCGGYFLFSQPHIDQNSHQNVEESMNSIKLGNSHIGQCQSEKKKVIISPLNSPVLPKSTHSITNSKLFQNSDNLLKLYDSKEKQNLTVQIDPSSSKQQQQQQQQMQSFHESRNNAQESENERLNQARRKTMVALLSQILPISGKAKQSRTHAIGSPNLTGIQSTVAAAAASSGGIESPYNINMHKTSIPSAQGIVFQKFFDKKESSFLKSRKLGTAGTNSTPQLRYSEKYEKEEEAVVGRQSSQKTINRLAKPKKHYIGMIKADISKKMPGRFFPS